MAVHPDHHKNPPHARIVGFIVHCSRHEAVWEDIGTVLRVTLTFTDLGADGVRSSRPQDRPQRGPQGSCTAVRMLGGTVGGTVDIVGILPLGVVCGTLNKLGVGYGVQSETLYSSPRIVLNLL